MHVDVLDTDASTKGKIGHGEEFTDEQLECCWGLCNAIKETLKNEPTAFIHKYIIIEDGLKAQTQHFMEEIGHLDDKFCEDDIKGVIASNLCAGFVFGYVAAKYPEKFKDMIL